MNIDLTETEIIHLMDCIGGRMDDLNDCAAFGDAGALAVEIETLDELMDKLSAALQDDDGWVIDAEINAETQMFNAGVDAREQVKATSRAAALRPADRSEMQGVDVWDSNDPNNW